MGRPQVGLGDTAERSGKRASRRGHRAEVAARSKKHASALDTAKQYVSRSQKDSTNVSTKKKKAITEGRQMDSAAAIAMNTAVADAASTQEETNVATEVHLT